jgi:hypothetical protein
MPSPPNDPRTVADALRDAASDCRHFALIGEPSIDTLADWADLFDSAADAIEATDV